MTSRATGQPHTQITEMSSHWITFGNFNGGVWLLLSAICINTEVRILASLWLLMSCDDFLHNNTPQCPSSRIQYVLGSYISSFISIEIQYMEKKVVWDAVMASTQTVFPDSGDSAWQGGEPRKANKRNTCPVVEIMWGQVCGARQ